MSQASNSPFDAQVRGHHLFCLLAFESGQQYGEFEQVFKQLREIYLRRDRAFDVVVGNDDACRACRYFSPEEGCISPDDGPESRVRALDKMVLDELELTAGVWKTSQLHERLARLTPDRANHVCSHCPWHLKGGCAPRLFEAIRLLNP